VLIAVTALAVLAAAVGTAWWWRHPSKTFEGGITVGMNAAIGERVWNSLDVGPVDEPGSITIRRVRPDIGEDDGRVRVDYAICQLDPEAVKPPLEGVGYGSGDDDMARDCTTLKPAEGATMRLGVEPGDELVVGVTPTALGRTVLRDHRIDFSQGWQRGRDTIDVRLEVTGITAEQAAAEQAEFEE
jgi:hypothetical protein